MNLDYDSFLDKLTDKLKELGIDLSDAKLDHVAYQSSSSDEYDHLKPEFEKMADLVREPIVGGRRVGVFKFHKPQVYRGQSIVAIELIEPKEGQVCESGLEHAEYLLPVSLEDFIKKYPDVNWNTDNVNREQFPMLILRVADNMQVKFPRNPVLSPI